MPDTFSPLLNGMRSAVYKTSGRLRRDFAEVAELQVAKKGPADFVSNADLTAEKTLIEILSKLRPHANFLAEESGKTKGKPIADVDEESVAEGKDVDVKREEIPKDQLWIIDPLDGTTNFLHGLPHWAISVGYAEEGELKAAVIFDPIKDELFAAEKGYGAYLNEKRLRVSSRDSLQECIFSTGIPFLGRGDEQDHQRFATELQNVMAKTAGVRRFGAASLDLAYVAAGRYDGFWERALSPWDIAAGILIVLEAGGRVTDFSGKTQNLLSGDIVASSPLMHSRFLDLVS